MDSQDNGTSWVGNICKKFETKLETFCSGIDSITSLESFEYAENRLLTAGENVKQLCSEFIQEMLPDYLKETMSDLQEIEEFDLSACEPIKSDMDEGRKTGVSDCNSSADSFPLEGVDEADSDPLFSGKSCNGKEVSSEENPLKVTVFPSKIAEVEASEKDALGLTSLVSGVNQSHDGGFDGQIDLTSPESVKSQSSYLSAKGGRTHDPVGAKVDSSTIFHSAIVIAGSDKGEFLENEDSSSGVILSEASSSSTDVRMPSFVTHSFQSCGEPYREFAESKEALTFSALDGRGDTKTKQRKDAHVSAIGMDNIESFNILTVDGSCIKVDGYEICSASDLQAEYGTSQAAGSGDNNAESDQTGGNGTLRSLHTAKPNFVDQEVCESDWEII